jgi:hypothetical protein
MSIDWSKAPQGTTGAMVADFHGSTVSFGDIEWIPSSITPRDHYEVRPGAWVYHEAPVLWNGEGLPPVGVTIEISHKNAQPDWANPGFRETKIVAMGEQLMILEADGSGHEKVAKIADYHFRPIRTAEQIAAEEREAACRQLCIDAGSTEQTYRQMETAYRLYDAGYRKQVAQ